MPAQPIPSVFRPSGSGMHAGHDGQGRRPRTLAELSEMATMGSNRASLVVDSTIPITRYLIGSETLTKQAETFLRQENLDEAFIALVKNCKLLIENLPNQHRGYQTLDGETKKRLKAKGQWNLDQLSLVKVRVVDRFENWRRANPNAPLSGENAVGVGGTRSETQREALRPVPSTGFMEDRRGQQIPSLPPAPPKPRSDGPTIEYVKPSRRGGFGFDVRDVLDGRGRGKEEEASRPRAATASSSSSSSSFGPPVPYISEPSHSRQRSGSNLSMGVRYPSLQPASSARMTPHQISQGFAPRSEQTFRYYQIQPSALPFPMPQPHPAPRHEATPSSLSSLSRLSFPYPNLSHPAPSHPPARGGIAGSVEGQAKSLLESSSVGGTKTEGGEPLRTLVIPASLISTFVSIAERNTRANVETCGLLMGTIDANLLQVNNLLIPKQTATSDRCDTEDEEGIWNFMESRELVTLGWCHTHPQQSCFMSSLDLHTHSAYQATLPEAVAIVCAPNDEPSFGLFRLTSPFGLQTILSCRQPGLFHPHVTESGKTIEAIYTDAVHGHVILADAPLAVTDLRRQRG